MKQTFLQLGTNLGNRIANLHNARFAIQQEVGKVVQSSKIYETAAWGILDQASFLNQVLEVHTDLSPESLLTRLQAIEQKMGRQTTRKWGERLIDLDILFYETAIIDQADLIIPHPELQNRKFVLVPLAEIAANFIHPVLSFSIQHLLQTTSDQLSVTVFDPIEG